jgi:hypothetical protein
MTFIADAVRNGTFVIAQVSQIDYLNGQGHYQRRWLQRHVLRRITRTSSGQGNQPCDEGSESSTHMLPPDSPFYVSTNTAVSNPIANDTQPQ